MLVAAQRNSGLEIRECWYQDFQACHLADHKSGEADKIKELERAWR